jgi:serine/threonine protein kinase
MGAQDASRPSLGRLNIARASGSIGEGRYRVFANIGRGGMADVLLGVAPGTKGFNKLLVVKRLRPALADDPSMVSMFLDEARLAARLSHTNLVHTFEIGEEAGGYFFVMEYLEGRPVSQIFDALKETGARLPLEVWAKIMAEALAGLHYAHELCDYDGVPLKIIHRDVSPQNIIVTFDGGVKLVDFGIAKASVNITETETGILKGKLAYMSPEQARAGAPIDRRADVFAAGIVLWECLAMKRLITGDAIAAARKLHGMRFAPPSSENPEVPPELDAITMRALERDPNSRFQTAEEMRSALEGYLRTSGHYVQEADIGAPIAKLFAEQRQDVRAQIRMHMANLRSEREVAGEGDDRPTPSERGVNVEWPKELASLPRIDVTESARSMRAVQKVADPWRGPSKWMWGLTATAAGAIALLGAFAFGRPSSGGRGAIAASPSSLADSARPIAPPADLATSPVHVALRASPPEATIALDDAVLTNPFSGSFTRDAIVHRLQVTREGYLAEGRLLRFDGDDVDLALSLPAIADAAPSAVKPRPPGARTPRAQPSSSRPQLDKDPYE